MRATRSDFLRWVTALRVQYSNRIDEVHWRAMVPAYWETLKAYPAEQLRAAFDAALQRYPDWFPSCGQLLQLLDGDPATAAEDAWPEVLRLASRSSGEHSDPLAKEAIRLLGGGAALGRMPSAELGTWGRKQFVSTYTSLARARQGPAHDRMLSAGECPKNRRTLPDAGTLGGDDENGAKTANGGSGAAPVGAVDTHAGSPVHEYPERSDDWWH